MSATGPQDSPTWPPPPQDRADPPTAASAPSPAPVRPSRRPRRIALFAAGALVVAGAGTAVALSSGHRVEQREVLTNVAITALTIHGTGGDVTVRSGATANTVEVVRRGSVPREGGAVAGRPTMDGTNLVLRPDCVGGCDVDYQVTVPDGVAVTVETGSGDIELNGSLGTVSLQSGSGDIDADLTSASVTVRTGSGDAELRLREAANLISATSGSGDLDIRVPRGEIYSVQPQTGSGDIDLNVQQGPSDHAIQVRTGSGDISVDDD